MALRATPGAAIVLGWVLAQGCGGAAFTATAASGTDASMGGDSPGGSDGSGGMDAPEPGDAADSATPADGGAVPDSAPPPAKCDGVVFQCVPDVPANWSGPVEVATSTGSGSLLSSCDLRFAGGKLSGYEGLVAPSANCGCVCGKQAVSCGSALTFYDQLASAAGCGTAASCYSAKLVGGACTTLMGPSSCSTIAGAPAASAVTSISASCPASPTTSKQAISWMGTALGCLCSIERSGADCPAGDICAPSPGASFGTKLCIEQAGNLACPTTGYTSKTVYYTNPAPLDARTCSSCMCEGSGEGCANESISVYPSSDGSCSDMPITYVAPFSCEPVSASFDVKYTVTPTLGSCAVSTPSTPTGAATPIDPFTVCCLP